MKIPLLYALSILFAALAVQVNAYALPQSPTYFYNENGAGIYQTVVASAVVTKSPYDADSTGRSDATSAIQSAINDVAHVGGGVVYLPAGKYLVGGHLSLGYGVTLMGAFRQDAGRNANGFASQINATGGAGTSGTTVAPLINTSGGETAIEDIAVYYPNQTASNPPVPYPYTISVTNTTTTRNVMLYNSYDAMYVPFFNCCVLSNVFGTALHTGLFETCSQEFCWMYNIHFANSYWENNYRALGGSSMSASQKIAIEDYTKANLIGFEFQRCDGAPITDISAVDAMLPIWITPNPAFNNGVNGFCAIAQGFSGKRQEDSYAPWNYGVRYTNVDNSDWKGGPYQFAATPVPSKPKNFLNVASYGRIGQGSAQVDTAAMKHALSAASRAGGGTVYLPQGKYLIEHPLTIPAGVELRGPLGCGKGRDFVDSCTLCCQYESNAFTSPFIGLSKYAGIRGLTIAYPQRNWPVYQVGNPKSLSQTISGFTPGQEYTVSFVAAERSGSGQTWNVCIDGKSISSFAPPVSAKNYAPYSATFTAGNNTQTLSFLGTNIHGTNNTILIEDIYIVPAAWTDRPYPAAIEGQGKGVWELSGLSAWHGPNHVVEIYQLSYDGIQIRHIFRRESLGAHGIYTAQ